MQLDARETAARLPYPELADAIAAVLLNRDKLTAPERSAVALGEGNGLLLMPASSRDLTITKLVTVHPDNPGRGLPSVQSEIVVMRTDTGVRLGMLDGVVTERRTAALSLLAVKTLAAVPNGPLLIFGAGVQARAHLEAFRVGLGIEQVFIASRTQEKAAELVTYAQSLGMDARVAEPAEVAADASLIVTATTSRTPVLTDPVRQDAFICAVGSFQPEVAEVSAEIIGQSRVVVDTLAAAQTEAGDLIQAVAAGRLQWSAVVGLESLLSNPTQVDQPTVFKSVGHALFDLAAAHVAFGVPII